MTRIVLFRRRYLAYAGGHGKVWDYFQHFMSSGLYEPLIHFTPDSVMDDSNPWRALPEHIVTRWEPARADLLFVEGGDWEDVPSDLPGEIPIINLVQHVRHADPRQPRYQYLPRRAIRICVSAQVSTAILATGKVRGPVFTIPCGIDLPIPDAGRLATPADGKVVIGALKDPAVGLRLADSLRRRGIEVDLLVDLLPRLEFLSHLAEAGIVVLLPQRTEGFYLPGLEAMALGVPVIMPDCIGNREYARHGENCFIADLDGVAIAIRLLRSGDTAVRMAAAGKETAGRYTLAREGQEFARLLQGVEDLWSRTPEA